MAIIVAEGADTPRTKHRALLAACAAHVVHDGFGNLLYLFLPIWKTEFGLDYAALGLIRGLYSAATAGGQIPLDRLTAPFGARASLVGGTLVAAVGFGLASVSQGVALLCLALVVAGLGSSTQHPRASVLVTDAYGGRSRDALGVYNFAGDIGKVVFPTLTSLALIVMPWRETTLALAVVGLAAALLLCVLVPRTFVRSRPDAGAMRRAGRRGGLAILFVIGLLDTAARMGFLLFLPFILIGKHADQPIVGMGLALVAIGGAFGKVACGWLGQRAGLVGTVVTTECATAVMIAAVPVLPLGAILVVLPVLGVALNGTSSVLYGTVPEVASDGDLGRAFALIYTGVFGSDAVTPIIFGTLADAVGRQTALLAAAATALMTIPLVFVLARSLQRRP